VRKDYDQISKFVDAIFSEHPGGMYFDEFVKLAKEVTSELFVVIFDCIYQCVPCVKNFLMLRANFYHFIKLNMDPCFAVQPTFTVLMPPTTVKIQERITEYIDNNPQKKDKFFKRETSMKQK